MKILSVASYILDQYGPMTAMKLQKLVYYSQAWHMVWEETPLFENEIQAWANGPVSPDLYSYHAGAFRLEPGAFSNSIVEQLSSSEIESIDKVCEHYSQFTAQQLSDKTHSETPWLNARKGYEERDRCNEEITRASIHEYYSGL